MPVSKAQSFLEEIKRRNPPYQGLSAATIDEAAFATLPGSGAGIYVVNGGVKA